MRHNHNDKIAVVLVNYNGLNDTLDCIKSIHGADIIVVDNASHSNELSLILEKYPYVIGIQSKENSGFSGGNNFGIHYALKHGYTHIMLLNNDTEIDKDMIRHLVENCSSDSISVPKMLYYSNPDVIWYGGGDINKSTGNAKHWQKGEKDTKNSKIQKCTFATGCCMMIPREVFEKVGILEEKYFMYCEDTEFCVRLALAGINVNYVPNAKLWHKIGASSSGEDSPFATYYMTRNRFWLVRDYKNYFHCTAFPFVLLTRILWVFRSKGEVRKAFIRGIKDGLAGA